MKFVHSKIDFSLLGQIFSIGFPSFIVQGAAAVMVIDFNIAFSHFVGEKGIIAYAVVNYMYTVFLMMFTGIGAALQPITSYHYGALLYDRMKKFIKIALITALIIGTFSFLFGVFGNGFIIQLFGMNDPEIIAYTKKGIAYFSGYLFR